MTTHTDPIITPDINEKHRINDVFVTIGNVKRSRDHEGGRRGQEAEEETKRSFSLKRGEKDREGEEGEKG